MQKRGISYLSLNVLLNRINRRRITATTWNKSKRLETVTKLGLTSRGEMIIFGERDQPLIIGQPKDIFFNPPGLITETELGLLPLAINEEGDWMQNIMELDTPEYIQTSSGKLKFKTASTKPVYEIMRKKDKEKAYWKTQAEESELLNAEYLAKLEEKDSELKILKESLINTKTNYVNSNKSLIEILKAFYPLEQESLILRNVTSAQDEDLESQEAINTELREKAEGIGAMTSGEEAINTIKTWDRELRRRESREERAERIRKEELEQKVVTPTQAIK